MNIKYILKQIRKANKKIDKTYYYLKTLETKQFDRELQINISRVCDIDEILSNLEIEINDSIIVNKGEKYKDE